jgi:hypothetical protein
VTPTMASNTRRIRWRHVLPQMTIVQRHVEAKVVAIVAHRGLMTEAWFEDGTHTVHLSLARAHVLVSTT